MTMNRDDIMEYLLDHPDDSDKLRRVLCPADYICAEAAALLTSDPGCFDDILRHLPDPSHSEAMLKLKQKLETQIHRRLAECISSLNHTQV